jgi:hypothetical protein
MTQGIISKPIVDTPKSPALPAIWSRLSNTQKIIWGVAILWVVVHVIFIVVSVTSGAPKSLEKINVDLKTYFTAGQNLSVQAPIYELGSWKTEINYRYHPIFAWLFSHVTVQAQLTFQQVWAPLMAIVYLLGVFVWYRAVRQLDPEIEKRFLFFLPLAIVASEWLATLGYGNVALVLVVLTGLLTLVLANKSPFWAGVLTALIILMKPQWAFPLLIPVVLKDWKLLFRTLAIAAVVYGIISLVFVVAVGPNYGVKTLQDYVTFMLRAPGNYPWMGQEAAFNTNQNAIYQTWLRYFGFQGWVQPVSLISQVLLLVAFLITLVRAWSSKTSMTVVLAFLFAGYAIGTLMLSEIQDCTLGALIFVYILSTGNKRARLIGLPILLIIVFEIPGLVFLATGIQWFNWPEVFPMRLIVYLLILWSCLTIVNAALKSGRLAQSPIPE